jgi:16S rRNA (cytosine1402-N4)-methyltransferase
MTKARPPRRKRYSGTHPRRFDERYKELDSAKFPELAAKLRARGRTPAGTHVPVMLPEVLAALAGRPNDVFLDCTLGYGGHTEAMAPLVARIIALDLDAEEQARSAARLKARGIGLSAHHANFAGIPKVLKAEGIPGVDLLLADLGVSSMQLDRPERGFSLKGDTPLDMRMDRSRGRGAAQFLQEIEESALALILSDFGDEAHAAEIAAAIKRAPPQTGRELTQIVLEAKGLARFRSKGSGDAHPAARVFQALRVAVNREMENLGALLRDLPWVLNQGARAAIITFHSGEERRVREALAAGTRAGHFTLGAQGQAPAREEVLANPRARSARLFSATRL